MLLLQLVGFSWGWGDEGHFVATEHTARLGHMAHKTLYASGWLLFDTVPQGLETMVAGLALLPGVLSQRDSQRTTPLALAQRTGQEGIVRILRDAHDTNAL